MLWRWFWARAGPRGVRLAEARRAFHFQRERLEAKFLLLGMVPARPDVPAWVDCQFEDDVAYARNRTTGELTAFVAVTITVDEPGRSSGGKDPAGNVREATAVFRFDRGHWDTDGKVIYNKSPAETIRFYHRDWELLGQEVGQRP
ncbi:MAG: hypothetical protein ACUVUC_07325 [Thermoguttaceae bacterium]